MSRNARIHPLSHGMAVTTSGGARSEIGVVVAHHDRCMAGKDEVAVALLGGTGEHVHYPAEALRRLPQPRSVLTAQTRRAADVVGTAQVKPEIRAYVLKLALRAHEARDAGATEVADTLDAELKELQAAFRDGIDRPLSAMQQSTGVELIRAAVERKLEETAALQVHLRQTLTNLRTGSWPDPTVIKQRRADADPAHS